MLAPKDETLQKKVRERERERDFLMTAKMSLTKVKITRLKKRNYEIGLFRLQGIRFDSL